MLTLHNLDRIVSQNGNWRLVYDYNNFGYNTLMLLPNFCVGNEEKEVNAILSMNDSIFEESSIIDDYVRSCPNTPFVIREENFVRCLEVLQDRLANLIDGNDFSKFNEESARFFDFLKVCYLVDSSDEAFAYQVSYTGWEKYIPKGGNN